jgi:hypothetical protein
MRVCRLLEAAADLRQKIAKTLRDPRKVDLRQKIAKTLGDPRKVDLHLQRKWINDAVMMMGAGVLLPIRICLHDLERRQKWDDGIGIEIVLTNGMVGAVVVTGEGITAINRRDLAEIIPVVALEGTTAVIVMIATAPTTVTATVIVTTAPHHNRPKMTSLLCSSQLFRNQ